MVTHSTPVPTDADFNVQHPAPKKLLYPAGLKADKFYHLIMKEKLWSSWSSDSHGVYYFGDGTGDEIIEEEARMKVSRKPFEVDVKGKSLSLRDRMVVRVAETKEPVAVMLKMFSKWETTYKIYGFEPYLDNQAPSEKQTHDDKPLYEWAQCKDNFFSVRKTMKMIDGVKYVMDGVGKVFAAKRQMRIARDDVPCVHMVERNLGIFTGNQWDIKIGPGIDPCLIIAFAAVMDEMNEDKD